MKAAEQAAAATRAEAERRKAVDAATFNLKTLRENRGMYRTKAARIEYENLHDAAVKAVQRAQSGKGKSIGAAAKKARAGGK